MSLIRQFAIRNELLYSGFVLPNVQIFFVQKFSFATFGVSIDDFFTRYAGLGYSLVGHVAVILLDICFKLHANLTSINGNIKESLTLIEHDLFERFFCKWYPSLLLF